MGGSSSTEQVSPPELRDAESLAASTGALPMLQKAFSVLSDPLTHSIPLPSLQKCFGLTVENQMFEESVAPKEFSGLLEHIGASIVDQFFMAEKGGVNWIEFLRGYTKCCGRMTSSNSFNNLCRMYWDSLVKAGLPTKLQFESTDVDCKMSGSLLPSDLLILLWMCWVISGDSSNLKSFKAKADFGLPDLNHLVLSAILSCSDDGASLDIWDCNVLDLDILLSAGRLHLWAIKTVPYLPDCLVHFVHERLSNSIPHEDKLEASCSSSTVKPDTHLLTCARAWTISLTLKGVVQEEILKAGFPNHVDEAEENLLYRSSLHGKGLNRFWSNVEGYNGPLLVLIAASSGDGLEDHVDVKKWMISALTQQGFENKDTYYGNSCTLYTISPVFQMLSPSGKEKNFVYSHLHPAGRVYDPHPKPVGIAFGGSAGNERIFMDEDFSGVTVRHHALDKTYLPGSLFPNQGFLPVEASILEVEVWGLAGRRAREIQISYKKREELFTDQRRKVDLKTFANWEDSPEKMMMDMITDPNAVRREDR